MHFEPVEARHDLLNRVQLCKCVLNPILVTVLHLLEFGDNIIVAACQQSPLAVSKSGSSHFSSGITI